ncbi:hypothetical protein [Entomobacter blattae]|nr:hypothetical protein [Entomobacter blattae]
MNSANQKPAPQAAAAQAQQKSFSREDLILMLANQISGVEGKSPQDISREYILTLIKEVALAVDGK